MSAGADAAFLERRLLVLAPVGRDAALVQDLLRREGVACFAVPTVDSLLREQQRGAGALLLAEEALAEDGDRLADVVKHQPPWSDLPILVLTRTGSDSAAAAVAVGSLGNVTLIERPVRIAALASAVRSALRARERQYETRAHMLEREEADRRKDEFLAMLAHELRNPLAPIRNSLHLLRMTASQHPETWEMMERQVGHMVRLVDDLMELSRITRGTIELLREPTDLSKVIASAVETSRPLIDAANHRLELDLPREPLVVEGDALRLAQVLSNLLNNAVKYTDPGGRIGIEMRREEGNAVVSVRDSGIGISPAVLPRVFDMFVQGDRKDRRTQGGLGIGLTLARRLVQMHGGTITASSAGANRGCEFTVRLPLVARAAAGASGARGAPRRLSSAPRALVVDDNRDAADSLGAVLRVLGADVRVTYDGVSALDEVRGFEPAAVFLDLGMPGMDGHEVARRIRAHPGGQDIVLAALTGWGQEKDRRATQDAGFSHHIVKPADIGVLQTVLAQVESRGSRAA